MKQWLNQLAPRERQMVLMGAPLALIIFIYFLLWTPFNESVHRLQQAVVEQQELKQWMNAAAAKVKKLRGSQQENKNLAGQSMLALVDKTAGDSKLQKSLKRVEPDGKSKVRIRMEQVSFDELMRWLELLKSKYGIVVENITVDQQAAVGLVNAKITLTSPE